jgi:hypothetical protein
MAAHQQAHQRLQHVHQHHDFKQHQQQFFLFKKNNICFI